MSVSESGRHLIDRDHVVVGRYRTNNLEQIKIFQHLQKICCLLLEDVASPILIGSVSESIEVERSSASESPTLSTEILLHFCNEMMELGVHRRDQRIVYRERKHRHRLLDGNERPEYAKVGTCGDQLRLPVCGRCTEVAKGLTESGGA